VPACSLQVSYLSFSAHADAKGILQLMSAYAPKSVVLVHGDKAGMDFLAGRIQRCAVSCTAPLLTDKQVDR